MGGQSGGCRSPTLGQLVHPRSVEEQSREADMDSQRNAYAICK